MQLSESKLFTIETLNRIEGFVWPKNAKHAFMNHTNRFVSFTSGSYPVVVTGDGDLQLYHGVYAGDISVVVAHQDWRNSLITKAEFDSVDGWVRSWVASVPESIPACGIEVECGIFGRKWRYRKPTKETTMPSTKQEVKPEIHAIHESYKQQRETTADAQRALDASKDAEDALLEQIKQWNLQYGFDVRLLDESEENQDQQENELVITDWQDLQAGDIIWWCGGVKYSPGEYTVENVYKGVRVFTWDGAEYVDTNHTWKFIRRPQ